VARTAPLHLLGGGTGATGWEQLLTLFAQLLRGIEHMQARSAAHGTISGTQLRKIYAKAGGNGALEDEAWVMRRSG
jgi:hypothetical protein